MKWHKSTVTRKGQVTIPVAIRRAMGLQEGDLVAFVRDGDLVRLTHWIGVVERTAGMAKHDGPALSAEEERAPFEQAVAEEVMESMRR